MRLHPLSHKILKVIAIGFALSGLRNFGSGSNCIALFEQKKFRAGLNWVAPFKLENFKVGCNWVAPFEKCKSMRSIHRNFMFPKYEVQLRQKFEKCKNI